MNRKIWRTHRIRCQQRTPSRPISPDVAAAKTNFDGITYAKGAAVLKQPVAWVGEDAFLRRERVAIAAHQLARQRLRPPPGAGGSLDRSWNREGSVPGPSTPLTRRAPTRSVP